MGASPKALGPGAAKADRTRRLDYRARQFVLGQLGFDSYAGYLRSDLWAKIRERVFAAKGKNCWICRRPCAAQVHHEKYTEANLRGESLQHLRPVCFICHRQIELDGEHKRDPAEVRRVARKLRKSREWRERLDEARRAGLNLREEFCRLSSRDG